MPVDLHWLRPWWLAAIPVVVLLTLAMARRRLKPGSWQRVVDPALAPYVLAGGSPARRDMRWWLMLAGGIVAAVALAGPAWNRVELPVFRSDRAMVIALDLSRSMDAQDLTPSRLARARLKILDILERRASGQTALVVYSANAFTVTPLTTDVDTIGSLVNSLSTDIMPSHGSFPGAAIEKGRSLLRQAGVRAGEILLITDGGSTPIAERAAEQLTEDGYTLSVLGVGTLEGAPIPQAGGGFVTDGSGRIAVPKLESDGLRALAAAGGGRYAILTTDNGDIDTLLGDRVGGTMATDESLAADQWRDEGPWLLLLLLPLGALAFRRGWILVVVFCLAPLPEPAHAFGWEDLWQTRDQQAREELEAGNVEAAAALFEDSRWRAVAEYRAGEYSKSARSFAAQDDADSLYNLGNALARLGEIESAIDTYNRVLEMDPEAEDAAYNRDLLQKLLDRQTDIDSGEKGNQQSESGGEERQSQEGGQSAEPGEEGASSASGGDSGDEAGPAGTEADTDPADLEALQQELQRAAAEAEQQSGNAAGEEARSEAQLLAERRAQEERQAMEQWLRRIPDDPGGLLRRKFRYQYQRQGLDQDGNSLWPDDQAEPW
jgi:Ca-activated chloride channel homolog